MAKGTPIVIAGNSYRRTRKASKPKRKIASIGGTRKRSRLSGSGDYNYTYAGDTPFAKVGKTLGKRASRYIGFDVSPYTEMLGHGIGRILGSGDYTTGPMVKSNVLVNSAEVPKFSGAGRGTIVAHREYIRDITTSDTQGAFKVDTLTVQPGNASTFPWLSTIAQNYEQYKIHGMVFFFKSTSGESVGSTNTSLGTVIMSSEYNVESASYSNKMQMESAEFAQSGKPSVSMMHGLECDLSDRPVNAYFVRSGEVSTDKKWYDFAKFQIGTTGFQAASVTVGELWVTYVIEFLKPQIPLTIGGNQPTAVITTGSDGPSAIALLGTTPIINGTMDIELNANILTINNALPGEHYRVDYSTIGGTAVTWVPPSYAVSGGAAINQNPLNDSSGFAPASGVSTAQALAWLTLEVSDNNYDQSVSVTFSGFTVPTVGAINSFIMISKLAENSAY